MYFWTGKLTEMLTSENKFVSCDRLLCLVNSGFGQFRLTSSHIVSQSYSK